MAAQPSESSVCSSSMQNFRGGGCEGKQTLCLSRRSRRAFIQKYLLGADLFNSKRTVEGKSQRDSNDNLLANSLKAWQKKNKTLHSVHDNVAQSNEAHTLMAALVSINQVNQVIRSSSTTFGASFKHNKRSVSADARAFIPNYLLGVDLFNSKRTVEGSQRDSNNNLFVNNLKVWQVTKQSQTLYSGQNNIAQSNTIQTFRHAIAYCYLPLLYLSHKRRTWNLRVPPFFCVPCKRFPR